jgi:putative transposase
MSIGKHSEAQIIDALKQMEAGRTASELGRELGVSKHTIFFRNPTFISCSI